MVTKAMPKEVNNTEETEKPWIDPETGGLIEENLKVPLDEEPDFHRPEW